jgi:plasmid stabilization system protein ParE
MGVRVRWSPQSRVHLLTIRERIREDNPAAAERMRLRIRKVVELIGTMPMMGHPGRRQGTMEFVVAPYVVVYRVLRSEVRALAIFHGARDRWFSGNLPEA